MSSGANEKKPGNVAKQWGLLGLGTVLLGGSATTASQWLTEQQVEIAVKSGSVTAVVIGGIVFIWRQVIERQDHIMAVSESTITSLQHQMEDLGKRYDALELRYDDLHRKFDDERTGWFREKGELLREMSDLQQQLQQLRAGKTLDQSGRSSASSSEGC